MKELIKTILLFLGLILSLIFAPSCTKQEFTSPCNGDCETNYWVVYKNEVINPNSNGYYEVEWDGLNYFQIKGSLSELDDRYVVNEVPLVESKYDSDYWVVFDSLTFQTPMYSYLGWFSDQGLNTPIPIGSYTYTINDLISIHPPLNIVGYQIPKHFCTTCPYAPTILGTYSKYNYNPTQNIFLDNEMIGDTINIFIETTFNTEGGPSMYDPNSTSPKEIIETQIKVIII